MQRAEIAEGLDVAVDGEARLTDGAATEGLRTLHYLDERVGPDRQQVANRGRSDVDRR